jgi:glycosyltransferase involved in cell wall biosynthesis
VIPAAAVIAARNEAPRIAACIAALQVFQEIVVVDSASADGTARIAAACGVRVVPYAWNGAYPKKRQWCLDTLALESDWIFFVDADEIAPPALVREIAALFAAGPPPCAGYFIAGRYVCGGRALRFGLRNNKLALLDRARMRFPEIDDLGLPLGEIEGHYQPVLKEGASGGTGRLRAPLLHHADCEGSHWEARHLKYAAWEAGMNRRAAWPADPDPRRERMKRLFRALPRRDLAAFAHSYFLKAGFLDGAAGYRFARSRAAYYRMVREAIALNKTAPATAGAAQGLR